MKPFFNLSAYLLVVLILTACGESAPDVAKFEGFAQGTTYHITYWAKTPIDKKTLEDKVNSELADIDRVLSNYRPDSSIEAFNNHPSAESQWVAPEIVELFKLARKVSQASQGCYDLTIKPLFDLWGFQGDTLTIPEPEVLKQALSQVGMDKVSVVDDQHLQKPAQVRIDVSSVGQGYSVGRVSRVLEQSGVHDYLVEIGGELKTRGRKPDGKSWRIAVEKPLPGEQRMMKILSMPLDQTLSVMTSGTYRHYFDVNGQRYSHILDARTGAPVTHDLVAVTVLHEDPTLADAWSTALMCLGQQQAMQLADAENIKAFFVQQQGANLLESKSAALAASQLSFD